MTVTGVVLVACWYNISGKAVFASQVPAINIAIVALIVFCSGSIGLLLAGRRAVGLRRQRLLGEPAAERLTAAVMVASPAQAAQAVDLVGGEGLMHFHRSDCAMAQGRSWPAASAIVHAREGRAACGVCRP